MRSVGKIRWTFYLYTNLKTFLLLPYLLIYNWRYFGKAGIRYQEIDYDAVYGG